METKKPTSIRISDKGDRLLNALADELGVSRTGAIELAIRSLAEQKGVSVSDNK